MARRIASLTPEADFLLAKEAGLVVSGETLAPTFDWIVGLDEVGMGCLAGPVVAAGFALPGSHPQSPPKELRVHDSKKLSSEHRGAAAAWIAAHPTGLHSIQSASPEEIDEINILRASQLAMERAFHDLWTRIASQLGSQSRVLLFIDGNKVPAFVCDPSRPWAQRLRGLCLVKGDSRSFVIACASILAKEQRDAWMLRLHDMFPVYGWNSNVGYPTPAHKLAIRSHGFTPWHRRSFRVSIDGADPLAPPAR